MGEPAFDKLHGLFDGHFVLDRQKQMNVIRHDDEIVQVEFSFGDEGPQHIDKKGYISFRLKQASAHARLRGREEGAGWAEDVLR